jgi:hypothetical protein
MAVGCCPTTACVKDSSAQLAPNPDVSSYETPGGKHEVVSIHLSAKFCFTLGNSQNIFDLGEWSGFTMGRFQNQGREPDL